jgi:dolichyl-phosphate-mannose-protein mannosyltransferase
MSSPAGSVRHRGNAANIAVPKKSRDVTPATSPLPKDTKNSDLDAIIKANKSKKSGSEWDYRLAITIITILAFVTRFWGISHPNEVVFDEVHFGKVRIGAVNHSYSNRMIADDVIH